mmetsp:Transcript_16543/g.53989  ORF Transcript_16543/g.53989 Transcript_16543/m.53989 type:complete len:260 (+) Transcript_16543:4001-4780(+)
MAHRGGAHRRRSFHRRLLRACVPQHRRLCHHRHEARRAHALAAHFLLQRAPRRGLPVPPLPGGVPGGGGRGAVRGHHRTGARNEEGVSPATAPLGQDCAGAGGEARSAAGTHAGERRVGGQHSRLLCDDRTARHAAPGGSGPRSEEALRTPRQRAMAEPGQSCACAPEGGPGARKPSRRRGVSKQHARGSPAARRNHARRSAGDAAAPLSAASRSLLFRRAPCRLAVGAEAGQAVSAQKLEPRATAGFEHLSAHGRDRL